MKSMVRLALISPQLQIAFISAASAIFGSLGGGVISYLTNKNLNRHKWALEQTERLAASREQIYSEFLAEAGKLLLTAIDKKSSNAAEFSQFFSLLSRVRLVATAPVVEAAEHLAKRVTAAYLANPPKEDDREAKGVLAQTFIEASRQELEQLRTTQLEHGRVNRLAGVPKR